MSGFDLSALMGGFQQRIAEMKQKAAETRCVGEAGGGLVRVVVSGDYEVIELTIADKAMGDREMLEDLVKAATSEALRKAKSETEAAVRSLTGGLPIPPGLLPF